MEEGNIGSNSGTLDSKISPHAEDSCYIMLMPIIILRLADIVLCGYLLAPQ